MESDKDIVISGIGGRLPECDSVEEFMNALVNGVDLISETNRRHPPGLYGIPKRNGTLKNVDKFDNMFFGVPPRQVKSLDPRHKVILETTYECIVDAGYNPKELKGSRTGVYVAIAYSNSSMKRETVRGSGPQGMLAALAANRISFLFDFNGPSLIFDTACSSSFAALTYALKDLQAGTIDQAIVGGANLIFEPYETLEFLKYNMMALDGRCKVFCANRDGYVRSEAIVSMLLQKRSDARRIYMKILGAKTNTDGFSPRGLGTPRCDIQLRLIQEVYNDLNITPEDIAYFEIHGTGTPLGDAVECETVARMSEKRKEPLRIGSLKSNMGHAELASGLTALIKIAAVSHLGKIAPNLYLEYLDKDLPGIKEGKLQVIPKAIPLPPGFVSINSFGWGGTNYHTVLDVYQKNKEHIYKKPRHRLVCFSGRTPEAVEFGLNEISKYQNDDEFLALIDEIHKLNIDGHNYRGYQVIGENATKEIVKYKNQRPIWFIYSGVGSQRKCMGKDLLNIDVFRKTFDRCANALKPYGRDLYKIVTEDDDEILKDLLNVYIGVVAIQLGLTDVLRCFGIVPDGIAGHSLGEVACGYCDNTLTTEQTILLAYARGIVQIQEAEKIIKGQMVALGLSAKEISKFLPKGVYIACQNSSTSVTISGPLEETQAFAKQLQANGIFARNVESNNLALHTKYLEPTFQPFKNFLQTIIKEPILRSSKWISTSVPDTENYPDWARFNSVEYQFTNYSNPVLFDQIYKYIPDNAIVVEIGPHALLMPILKRELGPDVTFISMGHRSSKDNEEFLLSAIGKIFNAGQQPQLRKFYPDVTFPVSRGTHLISPLVKWDHSVSWELPLLKPLDVYAGTVSINLSNPEYSFLEGHKIGGKYIIMPGMSYVVILWKMVAEHFFLTNYDELPIIVEHISFKRSVIISKEEDTELFVNIVAKSGKFDIFQKGELIVTGTIRGFDKLPTNIEKAVFDSSNLVLKRCDIYKEFLFRQQQFDSSYQLIIESDIEGRNCRMEWKEEISSFLECLSQLTLCQFSNLRAILLQTYVERLTIDPETFFKATKNNRVLEVTRDPELNIIRCEGIEIIGMECSKVTITNKQSQNILLESYEFIAYGDTEEKISTCSALRIMCQIILQNCSEVVRKLSVCVIGEMNKRTELTIEVENILKDQPSVEAVFCESKYDELNDKYDILLVSETDFPPKNAKTVTDCLTEQGFIIYEGPDVDFETMNLTVVKKNDVESGIVYLLRPITELCNESLFINVTTKNFNWLEKLKINIRDTMHRTIHLLADNREISGILGLVNCLAREKSGVNFKAICIENYDSTSLDNKCFETQLRKNLVINISKNGYWGTYVHLPIAEDRVNNETKNASVNMFTPRDFSTLQWIKTPIDFQRYYPGSQHANVFYSAVNPLDFNYATAMVQNYNTIVPTDPELLLGNEFSGTSSGKRIMGLLEFGAISLQVQTYPEYTWEIPDEWTLEDAATVPLIHTMAYYGLVLCGRIKQGSTVLVHSGTNCIGTVLISIALHKGCDVYTVINTPEEKQKLSKQFPDLKKDQIGLLLDKQMERSIMKNTKKKGVDVILITDPSDLIDSSFYYITQCLSDGGTFIDFGTIPSKRNFSESNKIYSFHTVTPQYLLKANSIVKDEIHRLVTEGIKNGVVNPLQRRIFSETNIEQAFRNVELSSYKEKTLVKIRNEEPNTIKDPNRKISAKPRITFTREKSYIIIGGMTDFGLELANWMIRRGAKKIILNSVTGITSGFHAFCLNKWKNFEDVTIEVNKADVTVDREAQILISNAQQMGPVGGIFNVSCIIRQNTLLNQTIEDYDEAFWEIVKPLYNMDYESRKHCPELDHFVFFSSVTSGRGNISQENYGMAYSALEELCEKRKEDSLPALAVQFGPIETGSNDSGVLKSYLEPQSITSCLTVLEKLMLQNKPIVASTAVLRKSKEHSREIQTPASLVAGILGIKDWDTVDKSVSMIHLGLDSLMTSEVKATLLKKFQLDLNAKQIGELTFNYLINLSK